MSYQNNSWRGTAEEVDEEVDGEVIILQYINFYLSMDVFLVPI